MRVVMSHGSMVMSQRMVVVYWTTGTLQDERGVIINVHRSMCICYCMLVRSKKGINRLIYTTNDLYTLAIPFFDLISMQ